MKTTSSRRWWALGALTLSVLAVGLDGTVLSVALPTLSTSLHASESDLQWFSSGYLLVLAAAMIPAGLLGDRFGRKRILLGALALFGAGSAACAFVGSPSAFIVARAVLGLAGAGVIVMALAGLTVLFDEKERPKAVGVWAAANFLALPIGPILGGWLLTNYWWGWVFLMNVPVALLGLVAAFVLIPESRAAEAPGLDPAGITTSTTGLAVLTYGLIEAGQKSWTDAAALIPMAVGLAILAGFFLWERRLSRQKNGRPMIDPALLRSAPFVWGVVLAAIGVLAMIGVLFTMPQYFQGVLGTDAMGSGLRLLPLIGGLVLGAIPAERVVRVTGTKRAVAVGFAVMAAGLFLGGVTAVDSSGAFVALWMALVGAGMGLSMSTAASAALSELPEERSGIGSAVLQALTKIGGPLGSAVLGSTLTGVYHGGLHLAGLPAAAAQSVRDSIFGGVAVARALHSPALLHQVQTAFVQGMDIALVVSAGIAVAGAVLALLFLPGRVPGTAAREHPQIERGVEAEHLVAGSH